MNVKQQQSGNDGSFYLEKNSKQIAESKYLLNDTEMDIYHTEVSPEFEGQHLGEQLISAAVDYAREHSLKIHPSCSFARAMFGRHKEYSDVLAKS